MTSKNPFLALAALGVVFGDIGTSPLYGLRVALGGAGSVTPEAVYGVLSLVFWALVIVVTLKYVTLILKVDNGGEGGILALAALLDLHKAPGTRWRRLLLLIAIAGGALLFGDAVITPAISVLSAVEGLHDVSPRFVALSVPIACAILASLFVAQRFGIMRIGAWFGPIMLVWFSVLGASGLAAIWTNPDVLWALLPGHGLGFLAQHPSLSLAVLGGVFLTVTGGEALYADLGQFGRAAIARAWLFVALPGLLLNYFGQGAVLLSNPQEQLENTFYALFPAQLVLPAVLIATLATIIASQAVITGIFSLGRQAIELGFMPPMRVLHMAAHNEHDVFLPVVNGIVGAASIGIVILFQTSDDLANAYGISVAGAMVTTTILYVAYLVTKALKLKRPVWPVVLLLSPILLVDLIFLTAGAGKLLSGGLLPLALAGIVMLIVVSWQKGRARMTRLNAETIGRLPELTRSFAGDPEARHVGVFLVRPGQRTPAALHELLELVEARFREIVILSVWTTSRPKVPVHSCVAVTRLTPSIACIDVQVGYMQQIDLPSLIGPTLDRLTIDPKSITYVANLERPIAPSRIRSLDDVLYVLFTLLARLARRSTDRFKLPGKRTLEVGIPRQL